MKVAFLLEQCLARTAGGTGRYSREMAGALASAAGPRDAVIGWTAWHRDVGGAHVDGVTGPHRLPVPPAALPEAWSRGLAPAPGGADVIHAPTVLFPRARRTPVVVTIHDTVPWTHPDTLTARGAAWHRRMGERAARFAAAIVVPTHAVGAELEAHLPLRAGVTVIGEGASPTLRLPRDADQRAVRLALPDRYVLATGTAEPRKGLATLIDALARPTGPDVPLLLTGGRGWGGVEAALKERAQALPPGRVRHLGYVADEDLAVLMERATVLAIPSVSEGFGLPLLEAQTLGTAVVCSDVPALVEVAGGAARSFPRGDAAALALALAEVIESDDVRHDLEQRGRANSRRYTWERAARQLWALYRSLVPPA